MKAAVFYGGRDVRVEDVPTPEPGPGEVLVRVRAAGVCGSDLHPYAGRTDPVPAGAPGVRRGHEIAGEVAAVGPGVTDRSVGEPVGVRPRHLQSCGACAACRRGDAHLCAARGRADGRPDGPRLHSSGFSEYDVCRAADAYRLPDGVSFEAGSLLDCYACGVHAVLRTPVAAATVAILGTGAIGLTLGQVARAYGARQVVLVGNRPEPLRLARQAGAADTVVAASDGDPVAAVLEATGGIGADVVAEAVGGTADTVGPALRMARPGGAVVVLGMFTRPPALDAATAYGKELTLRWSNSYGHWRGVSEYQLALELLAAGRLDPEPLVTHRFPLTRIREAFDAALDKRASGSLKVVVCPQAAG